MRLLRIWGVEPKRGKVRPRSVGEHGRGSRMILSLPLWHSCFVLALDCRWSSRWLWDMYNSLEFDRYRDMFLPNKLCFMDIKTYRFSLRFSKVFASVRGQSCSPPSSWATIFLRRFASRASSALVAATCCFQLGAPRRVDMAGVLCRMGSSPPTGAEWGRRWIVEWRRRVLTMLL